MNRSFDSLEELAAALRGALDDPNVFYTVSARLVLRTGTDLCRIRPDQNHELVSIAAEAVQKMGIRL